jgi:hypothetical protein
MPHWIAPLTETSNWKVAAANREDWTWRERKSWLDFVVEWSDKWTDKLKYGYSTGNLRWSNTDVNYGKLSRLT